MNENTTEKKGVKVAIQLKQKIITGEININGFNRLSDFLVSVDKFLTVYNVENNTGRNADVIFLNITAISAIIPL
ncbi:MAG: DUF6812 domain-containing protein [Candidatus Heimdallarchaeaceae archaeon]